VLSIEHGGTHVEGEKPASEIATGVHTTKVIRVGSTALTWLLNYELDWEQGKWRLVSWK
jgi:hypothetical protein